MGFTCGIVGPSNVGTSTIVTPLTSAGRESEANRKGLIRLEGKEYVARDGDEMPFRFND